MYDAVVVGAGQSGLAMGYYLKQAGLSFVLLDENSQVGASWLARWDSLKLFTPTEYNHLPGRPFPHPRGHYPNKADVANYLKDYVTHFALPVLLNTRVRRVSQRGQGFEVLTQSERFMARKVIIASGPFHKPRIPACASELGDDVLQLHSKDYKNPQQLKPGKTLVVGAGDSGLQILEELAGCRDDLHFAGSPSLASLPQQFLGKTLWWWFDKLGLLSISKFSWLGNRLSKKMQPVIGIDVKALLSQPNIRTHGRVTAATDSHIQCADGEIRDLANVIWATGFTPDFSWIEPLALDHDGYPVNHRGVSDTEGLYFLGLPWMVTRGSATLGGVRHDAEYLIRVLCQKNAPTLCMATAS